ncbi:MAG: hypothetical protein WD533_07185 [Dehalococcoidia bacterium]
MPLEHRRGAAARSERYTLLVLRRTFAVFLIILFPLILLLTLLSLRVNATVLEADFYTRTLERMDAYNFLYEEAVPLALEDADLDLESDLPLGLELTPETLSAHVKHVLPPEWLEENVSVFLHQAVPYATGRTDTFDITVRLDDRATAAGEVVRQLVTEARIHDYLTDEIIRPEVEGSADGDVAVELPMGISLTVDQVVDGIAEVVPEDWIKEQAIAALDAVLPYLTASTNEFQVIVPLQDRAGAGIAVLERWMLESLDGGAYEYLLDETIGPVVRDGLQGGLEFPLDVTITEDEIMDAVAGAITEEWVAERVSDIVRSLGAYLTGRSDTLEIEVPLEERAEAAALALVELLDSKLEAAYNDLPLCTIEHFEGDGSEGEFPPCRPSPTYTYEDAKEDAGFDIENVLVDNIAGAMPPSIELTHEQLLGGLGEEDVENVRSLLSEGYVFTQADLRTLVREQGGDEMVERLEEVRGYMRDGFVLTDADFREMAGSDYEQVQTVRDMVGTARTASLFLFLLPLGMVAGVGFLGGASWGKRLMWAGIPLVIGGVIVGVASGLAADQLRSLTEPMLQDMDAPAAVVAKLIEVRNELVSAFISPVTLQSGVLAVLGFGAIVGGMFWARRI